MATPVKVYLNLFLKSDD